MSWRLPRSWTRPTRRRRIFWPTPRRVRRVTRPAYDAGAWAGEGHERRTSAAWIGVLGPTWTLGAAAFAFLLESGWRKSLASIWGRPTPVLPCWRADSLSSFRTEAATRPRLRWWPSRSRASDL